MNESNSMSMKVKPIIDSANETVPKYMEKWQE